MADAATKPKPRKATTAPRKRASNKAPPPRVWRPVLVTAAAILLLDQALKYIVVHVLLLDRVREIDVIDPWLNLRMAWNQGMNFGLFSSETDIARWVLIGIAFAVCLWVALWVGRAKPSRFAQISAGLLIGGAIGNVIDRLLYGAVADFLNMSLPGWHNPYSFNVADISIFLGAMGLVLQPPERKPDPKKPRKPAMRAPKAAPKAASKAVASKAADAPLASPQQSDLPLDDKTRDEAGNTR